MFQCSMLGDEILQPSCVQQIDTFIQYLLLINSLCNDNGIVVYYFIMNESLLPVIVVNLECEYCNYLCNGYRCLC
jgi:hypothetical protein